MCCQEMWKHQKMVATEKQHSITHSNSHRSLDFDSNQKDVVRFTHNWSENLASDRLTLFSTQETIKDLVEG